MRVHRQPRPVAPLLVMALVAVGSTPASAVTDASSKFRAQAITSEVERLAEEHNAGPLNEAASGSCRWVTQTVTHQAASQTRRVRVCGKKQSWWRRWIWAGRGG